MSDNYYVRINDYIRVMDLTAEWRQFDGGRSLVIKDRGIPVWRGSGEWGEERAFWHRVRAFLDDYTWPGDRDPRVQHVQPYSEGDF